jgi:23S rRNA (uracil1939-C5)-methyltransferase
MRSARPQTTARRTPPEIDVEIAALGGRGDGVGYARGHAGNRTVFVPFAAPGDRLRVEILGERDGGELGRIVERLRDGPYRSDPPCRHFGDCGGCALQHVKRDAYVAWKQALVGQALARRGVEAEILPLRNLPQARRRRAVLAAARRGDRLQLGFNASASASIVDLETCLILDPKLVALLPPLRPVLLAALGPREAADIGVTITDSGIDLWLQTRRLPTLIAREALVDLASEQGLARISAGPEAELVVQRRQPRVIFGGVAVALPPGAFLQPTAGGEAALVEAVSTALAGRARIADLYAGCGTFTFPLAASAKVHAVEGDGPALAALAVAARNLGGRVSSEHRDLARAPLTPAELGRFDAVVFDPPRAGAKEQAAEIARSGLDIAVAVSCHPGSFARDARILVDGGFRLERVLPVDQFPWSPHLELVGIFRR